MSTKPDRYGPTMIRSLSCGSTRYGTLQTSGSLVTIRPKKYRRKRPHPWHHHHLPPLSATVHSTTMATTSLSLPSTSSLWHHCTKPNSILKLRLRVHSSSPSSTSRTIITSMAATTATKVIPSIIVGGGRVGRALQDMGNGEDLLVRRGDSVPIDFPGPILVCTRNDDLDAVLESTPGSRWSGTMLDTLQTPPPNPANFL